MPQVGVQTQETTRTPLPPLVRNAWGDEVADTLAEWVDIKLERRVVTRAEYRDVLSRVDVLENRIAAPEQAVEQNRLEFHQRFDGMQERFDQRFDGMQKQFSGLRSELDQRLDGIQERFDQRFDGMQERFDGLRGELDQRIDALRAEVQEQNQALRAEMQEQNQALRAELKEELHEHRRETRIALDNFRQEMSGFRQEMGSLRREMQENFQTLHTQMLVQTRWMVGSLTVIGALVTLLLAIGTFAK